MQFYKISSTEENTTCANEKLTFSTGVCSLQFISKYRVHINEPIKSRFECKNTAKINRCNKYAINQLYERECGKNVKLTFSTGVCLLYLI